MSLKETKKLIKQFKVKVRKETTLKIFWRKNIKPVSRKMTYNYFIKQINFHERRKNIEFVIDEPILNQIKFYMID